MQVSLSNASDDQHYMYLLYYRGTDGYHYRKTFVNVTDCSTIPDDLLRYLMARDPPPYGCAVGSLAGIKSLLSRDLRAGILRSGSQRMRLID